jgi:SAM-dependent methyltransferase
MTAGTMTDAGTTLVSISTEPHLGGNIIEGDPYSFCPRVWQYVIDRFSISSVMDLGSGIGNAADYFFRRGLRTLAVDGLVENVKAAYHPTICHDLTKEPIVTEVDLVHCQEVVEHIEEQYLENVLRSLACGRLILMTHALPGQPGYHHVNLQAMDYWIKHVEARGYNFLVEDTNRIRAIATEECAIYMQNSGLLFHRKLQAHS